MNTNQLITAINYCEPITLCKKADIDKIIFPASWKNRFNSNIETIQQKLDSSSSFYWFGIQIVFSYSLEAICNEPLLRVYNNLWFTLRELEQLEEGQVIFPRYVSVDYKPGFQFVADTKSKTGLGYVIEEGMYG
jgi:hypothetical protein